MGARAAWELRRHACRRRAADIGSRSHSSCTVESHQIRAPDVLRREHLGEPSELMMAGCKADAFRREHGLEQLLRGLLDAERAVARMIGDQLPGNREVFLRERNEACHRFRHAAVCRLARSARSR